MSQQSPSESIISLNLQMRKWCLQRFPKAVQLAIIRTQMSSSYSLQESTDHMSQMQGLQRRGACVWTRKLGKWDSAKGTESRLVRYKYPRSRPWIPGNKKKRVRSKQNFSAGGPIPLERWGELSIKARILGRPGYARECYWGLGVEWGEGPKQNQDTRSEKDAWP